MNPTSICILDDYEASERTEENIQLIWAACLFGAKIAVTSWCASALYIPVRFDYMSEPVQMKLYLSFLRTQKKDPVILHWMKPLKRCKRHLILYRPTKK